MGARSVVVSRGPEPVIADIGDGELVEVVPPRLEELNPRGAGDTMTGALAAALAGGESLADALRLAGAAGALNVTRRGLGSGERAAIGQVERHVEIRPLERRAAPARAAPGDPLRPDGPPGEGR
jgi:1-phosphofructokinase